MGALNNSVVGTDADMKELSDAVAFANAENMNKMRARMEALVRGHNEVARRVKDAPATKPVVVTDPERHITLTWSEVEKMRSKIETAYALAVLAVLMSGGCVLLMILITDAVKRGRWPA